MVLLRKIHAKSIFLSYLSVFYLFFMPFLHSIFKNRHVSSATLFPNSLRAALETLPAPYRAGFSRPLRDYLLTENRPRRTTPYGYVHVADQYLGLLEDLGLPKGKAELPLPPPLPQPLSTPAGAERGAQQPYVASALCVAEFMRKGKHSNFPGSRSCVTNEF